jgi:hypothetical protein
MTFMGPYCGVLQHGHVVLHGGERRGDARRYGLSDIARHVIQRNLDTRLLR